MCQCRFRKFVSKENRNLRSDEKVITPDRRFPVSASGLSIRRIWGKLPMWVREIHQTHYAFSKQHNYISNKDILYILYEKFISGLLFATINGTYDNYFDFYVLTYVCMFPFRVVFAVLPRIDQNGERERKSLRVMIGRWRGKMCLFPTDGRDYKCSALFVVVI
jgi:hypothetical protein